MGHLVAPDGTTALPDAPVDAECLLHADLGWLLKQAFYAVANEIYAGFEPLDVSPRGFHVLETASQAERTQSEVADVVGLDKTTMVAVVDALEAAGLAERRPSPRDRRVRTIAVTSAGDEAVRQGREVVARIQADVLASLPGDHGEKLIEALRTLVGERLAGPVDCTPAVRRREPRGAA